MNDNEMYQALKEYMDNAGGFIQNNHYSLVEVGKDYCVMEAEIRDESLNPYGMVHGGFLFGLADTAAGALARVTGRKAVTLNSHIEYLHACYGSKIKAAIHPIKAGKSVSVYEACVYDMNEVMVAKAVIDYFYLS